MRPPAKRRKNECDRLMCALVPVASMRPPAKRRKNQPAVPAPDGDPPASMRPPAKRRKNDSVCMTEGIARDELQ